MPDGINANRQNAARNAKTGHNDPLAVRSRRHSSIEKPPTFCRGFLVSRGRYFCSLSNSARMAIGNVRIKIRIAKTVTIKELLFSIVTPYAQT